MAAKVDRQTTTPFLLKLFYRTGTFHRLEEFSPTGPSPTPPHLQIYTWTTCTLRELTHLLTSALPNLLPAPSIGTRLSFRLIYPDTRDPPRPGPGRFVSKELGSVVVGSGGPGLSLDDPESVPATSRLEGDLDKSLESARFVIGDYISCAIFPPLVDGAVVSASAAAAASGPGVGVGGGGGGNFGRSYGSRQGGRENGYPPSGFGGGAGGGGGGGGGPYGGGRPRGNGRFDGMGRSVPISEWRRGERLPDNGPSGGYRGRGRGRNW